MNTLTKESVSPSGARGRAPRQRAIASVLAVVLVLLMLAPTFARAQIVPPESPAERPPLPGETAGTWLDRTRGGLHRLVWRTARGIDGWMGPPFDDAVYQEASGSLAIAVLWDEFEGFDSKVRFHVNMPLPRINKRLRLFVGRVSPDEFVTERVESTGALPPLRGLESEEDETLAGLIYSRPDQHGGSFGASAGVRLRSSGLDPYVKASYRYQRTLGKQTLFTGKATVFYQVTEKFGMTTRVDLERMVDEFWRLRWTASATVSERSDGVRAYSTLTATRSLPGRRALVFRVGGEGETGDDVPLHEYGLEVAYRTSVLRTWLVLELRTSLMWPREFREQAREPSIGFGIGFEMYFGTDKFSSHPMMF